MRKIIEAVEVLESKKSKKNKKDRIKTVEKTVKRESPEEGFPGTVIGIPLDRENCESTDASGVSTPSGVLNPRKKFLTDGKRLVCPKCKSTSINIHDNGETFYCTDCGYSWSVLDADDDGVEDDKDNMIEFEDEEEGEDTKDIEKVGKDGK